MTAEQIMLHVDMIATTLTMEERTHLKRFFLVEYCSAWMPIRAIALATGIMESSRRNVYRSVKLVQQRRDYWITAHQINHAIKKKLPKV